MPSREASPVQAGQANVVEGEPSGQTRDGADAMA
jgi:hypothetical protein